MVGRWASCSKIIPLGPSWLPLHLRPLFSSSLVIMLKSPPEIHKGCDLSWLIAERVLRISAWSDASCGKYTLAESPCIFVPMMWKVACKKFLLVWILSSLIAQESQTISRPPKLPSASIAALKLPGLTFAANLSSALELHLVSCKKRIWGFSCFIMLLRIWFFPGPLSPLIFQDINFIGKDYDQICRTWLAWNTCLSPLTFVLFWLFAGDLFSYLAFWYLWL